MIPTKFCKATCIDVSFRACELANFVDRLRDARIE
jgi:hypothetical protein